MVCGILSLAVPEIFHQFGKYNSITNNSEACIAQYYLPALIGGCVKFNASHAWSGWQFISGDEEWKVEVCQDNEKHCFQMVGHTPWGGHG